MGLTVGSDSQTRLTFLSFHPVTEASPIIIGTLRLAELVHATQVDASGRWRVHPSMDRSLGRQGLPWVETGSAEESHRFTKKSVHVTRRRCVGEGCQFAAGWRKCRCGWLTINSYSKGQSSTLIWITRFRRRAYPGATANSIRKGMQLAYTKVPSGRSDQALSPTHQDLTKPTSRLFNYLTKTPFCQFCDSEASLFRHVSCRFFHWDPLLEQENEMRTGFGSLVHIWCKAIVHQLHYQHDAVENFPLYKVALSKSFSSSPVPRIDIQPHDLSIL